MIMDSLHLGTLMKASNGLDKDSQVTRNTSAIVCVMPLTTFRTQETRYDL